MTEKKNYEGYRWTNSVRYSNLTKDTLEETEKQEQIAVPDFGNQPVGRVTVSAHITKNLGNYESARVSVELSLPTLPIQEELVRVYDELQELTADMMNAQLAAFDPVKVEK